MFASLLGMFKEWHLADRVLTLIKNEGIMQLKRPKIITRHFYQDYIINQKHTTLTGATLIKSLIRILPIPSAYVFSTNQNLNLAFGPCPTSQFTTRAQRAHSWHTLIVRNEAIACIHMPPRLRAINTSYSQRVMFSFFLYICIQIQRQFILWCAEYLKFCIFKTINYYHVVYIIPSATFFIRLP